MSKNQSSYSSYSKLPNKEKLTLEQEQKCSTISEINHVDHFHDTIRQNDKPLIHVFDVYTDWCQPCKLIKYPYACIQDDYNSEYVKFHKLHHEHFSKNSANRNNTRMPI